MENQASIPDSSRRTRLLEEASLLTTSAGVYLMRDQGLGVLYVGKAKNLRNRVTTYFKVGAHEVNRTELMVQGVHTFEVILTETEAEALILENTLIKRFKPRFNVRLKDDKGFPYIRIPTDTVYPRLEWVRKPRRDESRLFGPFPSALAARQVLKLLTERLQLRDCNDNTFKHRSRPCILYQMGRCCAPCVALVSPEDYRARIQEASETLEGRSRALQTQLSTEMEAASEHEEFERAAMLRDRLRDLDVVTEIQGVMEAGGMRDRDVPALAREGALAQGVILNLRQGRLVGVKHYRLENADPALTDDEVLQGLLSQHYLGEGVDHPEGLDVVLDHMPSDDAVLEEGLHLKLSLAQSPDEERLVSVAYRNARYALEEAVRKATSGAHGFEALEDTARRLHLERPPRRIECFDISNIQGEDAVASRVVFIDAAPDKNLYRKYKIKTVEGANDFAMMKEVLGRRFSRSDEDLPDLVMVDGGKGQLNQAVAIMEELNITGVAVAGLAKARTEKNFKATEVRASQERIFLPGRKNPVLLSPHTHAFKLLTHVRDEAHRFAISYHRALRASRRPEGRKK